MDMAISVMPDTAAVTSFSEDVSECYPAEIFGQLPDGFRLQDQSIHVLVHWHRKAIAAVEHLPEDVTDYELGAACDIVRRLYVAILTAKTHGASHVALKLQAVLTKLDSEKSNSIEEALDVDDIRRLAAELSDAIKPSAPVKRVGALRRGRKLTRTGLLYRYQSFLMKELQTLSLNLYGDRDCALEYIAEDDAVNLRCSGRPKYPFFDESRLADRARSVLKSLKIDTKQFDILGRHGVTWATSESWPSRAAK
ncbi:hypothetical protein [Bradyrhizobium sp. 191]|uniref:hypothetical protein n=1 Tax=Bradyrhizobium sp. 191 TaxID=2782659 RepID=UPI001FFF61B4|nr:hypothetical protein [Bradyrhizobium sp. 191]UPJ63512.1 hypothetical protein IVB23_26265 [Bradyrhizobium sp. 191]